MLIAQEIAQRATIKNPICIIVIGGDGTIHEVVNGVIHSPNVYIGAISAGSGNDFARGIGMPDDIEALVDILLAGGCTRMDAGDANGEFFINVAGFGFDVDVVRYTEKYKKKLNGMLPYLLGIFQSLVHLEKLKVRAQAENGEAFDVPCVLFSVCNGNRFAGGIKVAPNASASDGLLDVCILKEVSRARLLYLLPIYMKGKHEGYKDFMCFRAKSISCECGASVSPLQLDGELIGTTPVAFSIRPGALNIITGAISAPAL